MAFFDLKDSDIITTTYTTYPSYNLTMSLANNTSSMFYIYPSTSVKTQRTFTDINGHIITGSYQLTGGVQLVTVMTKGERYILNNLRNIYASSSFKKPENYTSSSIFDTSLSIMSQSTDGFINIPSVLYGTKIKPASLLITTDVGGQLNDDGYGGLYNGNILVGCVFYEYGIIYAPLAAVMVIAAGTLIYLNFSGTNKTPMTMYMCRAPKASANFSNNPSYCVASGSVSGSVIFNDLTTDQPKTFITTVCLYDENYKMVGLAKVSNPVLNDEQTSMMFRLKLNK